MLKFEPNLKLKIMATTNYDTLILIITVAILISISLFFLLKKVSSRENKINDITSIIQKIKFLLNITIKEKDDKKLKVWHLVLIVVLFSWGATLSESDDVGETCSVCRATVEQMGVDPSYAVSLHKKICK